MKRMISGIKPTGSVHLGNFLGAIKPFVSYQDDYELYVFIADLHALTLPIDPNELRENTKNLLKIYIAAGLDKATIFKQSDLPQHSQLEWILTCNTVLGEFTKMPQYKNYVESHKGQAVPSGMLMYPSLMNADILLYDADYVPCGIDQKPHVDLTRDVADKFNKRYGEVFKLPEAVIARTGAKIMSLSDPTKKMSKSESDKGTIYLLEDIEITRKKIMKAVTDSEGKVYYNPDTKPGLSNLMTIYSVLTDMSFEEIEAKYKDTSNYGVFKKDLADIVCAEMLTIQQKVNSISDEELRALLCEGYFIANSQANIRLNKVYTAIGLH